MRCFIASVAPALVAGLMLAQPKQSTKTTIAVLDRMIANGSSQRTMAQYVFENYGCNRCHTVGQDGKLGFTEKGKQLTTGFEGCIRTLTAMNQIGRIPLNQRTTAQHKTAQRFDEFGCTLCHQVVPGKLGLTELGAKLTKMHLGCVDVEKTLASK
jgi:cytochrome c551/c552